MTTKADPADQVKFLVACIRSAGNGKPNFESVATQLGIVSKAAAQKRYERMLKAHNVDGTAPPAAGEDGEEPVTPKKTPNKRGAAAASDIPGSKRKKPTPKSKKAAKEEGDDEDGIKSPSTPTKTISKVAKSDDEMEGTDLSAIPAAEAEQEV